MQDNKTTHKETDITPHVIVALVLIVAVFIAKTAGDFSARKTSTSTRASERLSEKEILFDNGSCQSRDVQPLNLVGAIQADGYDNSQDKCGETCVDTTDGKSKCTWFGSTCCRNAVEVKKLGDSRCVRLSGPTVDVNAKCKPACDANSGESQIPGGCGYASYSGLQEGVCCVGPNSPASALLPTMPISQGIVNSSEDCGKNHINCKLTGSKIGLESTCLKGEGNTAWCGYIQGDRSCPDASTRMINVVYDSNGFRLPNLCLRGLKESILAPINPEQNRYFCSMTAVPIKNGMTTTEDERRKQCENAVVESHAND